jgi:GWxTD domain-containing protein
MLKLLRIVVLIMMTGAAYSQPLRDINYKYLYNPDENVRLVLSASRTADEWLIHYRIIPKDTATKLTDISIEWDTREGLGNKDRKLFVPSEFNQAPGAASFKIPSSATPFHLVAKLVNTVQKRAWIFYKTLEPNYPVNAYFERGGKPLLNTFESLTDSVTFRGLPLAHVSYYNDAFPAAQPPFSEAQGRVSKGMESDSLFTTHDGETVKFLKKGLYLFQQDTNAVNGVTVRVEDDYPKFAKIRSLAAPLVYITTSQEYNRLLQAKDDKKAFDRTILSITNDAERAKRLMKNYFRRVELANQFFTSYKEGWKTDRGMAYIVFGLPDEVFRFNDREVWNYSTTDQNLNLTFVKSSSLFDPDNYVLLRDKKYQQIWYQTIDLWRGSRF